VSTPTVYLTVAGPAAAETEVRRSRFLCRVERVESEEAARRVVEEQRRAHGDARHHCSAFVLGPGAQVQRSSDDGEPSGTAGAPMLEVVRGRGLSDVVVVVTRWFGGVLLGAGGLVRAYGDAVRAGLDAAGVRERRLLDEYTVDVPHADAGRLEHGLRAAGVLVLGVNYSAAARLLVAVPAGDEARLTRLLAELTGGALVPEPQGSRWADS
jgi:uncharacterized YigZ family protein